MLAENKEKNMNFMSIIVILRSLRKDGKITDVEYNRAKKYYRKLTGADLVIPD